jgi:hypothetical protein
MYKECLVALGCVGTLLVIAFVAEAANWEREWQ